MKKVYCSQCNTLLLELSKGQIRKGAVMYCGKCDAQRELALKLRNIDSSTTSNPFGFDFVN